MKLKPLVASLFVLGLVSGSALAANDPTETYIQQRIVEQNAVVSPVCPENWFNRISISGLGTFQATWGDRDPAGSFMTTGHSTDLYVNNFNIIGNAVLNSWTTATVNLAYIGYPNHLFVPSPYRSSVTGGTPHFDEELDELTFDPVTVDLEWDNWRSQDNHVIADEAYVTFANFCKTPFYFKLGKTYIPFGTYSDPYNFVLTPMTQMLSQNNQTAAILGFASDFGFYGNVYAFRGNSQEPDDKGGNIRNFGAELGYYGNLASFDVSNAHYNVNVGIIRAIQDGDYWTKGLMADFFHYSDPVPGFAAHADLSLGAWDFSANYVTALKDVNVFPDVPDWLEGIIPQATADAIEDHLFGSNRKIWAADVNGEYAFKTWCHDSKIGLSYQFGGNGDFLASTFHMFYPKTRFQADYKINLLKNVDFDLIYAYNHSYSFPNASTVTIPSLLLPFEAFGDIDVFTPVTTINTGLPNGSVNSNVVVGKLSVQF